MSRKDRSSQDSDSATGTVPEGVVERLEAVSPPWEPAPLDHLGNRIWAVLGGGGLKGLAHIGAWKAIQEARLRITGIVGTSIGAFVGALIAGGMSWEDLVPLAFALKRKDIVRINRRAVLINGFRQEALFQGDTLREYIERVLPVKRWEDLAVPLQINAVNLETGLTEWFGPGAHMDVPLADAIYASAALPVFYPPARIGNRVYVDGGAEHPFPLHRAAEVGATGIVGVDVGSGKQSHPHRILAEGMLAIHMRVFSMMSWRTRSEMVRHWKEPPLVFVRPRLEGYQTFDFDGVQVFLEEGYRATRAALMGQVHRHHPDG
jgi:NTE family protein